MYIFFVSFFCASYVDGDVLIYGCEFFGDDCMGWVETAAGWMDGLDGCTEERGRMGGIFW